MKYMKSLSIVAILLLFTQIALAQRFQRTDSLKYGDQVALWLSQSSDTTSTRIGRQFANLWYGPKLSDTQKATIQAVTAKMMAKNYNLHPYVTRFHETLLWANNDADISAKNLDDLLGMISQSVDFYERRSVGNMLKALNTFFDKGALRYAGYNQLYATGGQYSFEFVAPDAAKELVSEADLSKGEDEFLEEMNEEDSAATDEWETVAEDSDWGDDWGNEETALEEGEDTEEAPAETNILEYLVEEPVQPDIVGPVMRFEQVNLIFNTTYDSANLTNTSGALLLGDQVFVGEGGRFDWTMAGLSTDSVYCTLGKYNFNIEAPRLSAEKAEMTYLGKIDKPVEGIFQFASQRHTGAEDARYPRFKSYNNDVVVNIFDNSQINPHSVSYVGGFALQGNHLSSASLLEGNTTIKVQEKGRSKFRAVSKQFAIGDSLIASNRAAIAIYQGNDSIYHPAAVMKYAMDSSQLIIQAGKGDFKRIPFVSTHLKMDIRTDIMQWDLRTDSVNVSTLTARDKVPVLFESHEYFSDDEFAQLAQMYNFHPLIMAVGYARKSKSASFNVEDLARNNGQNPKIVRAAMKDLYERGYIDYDAGSGDITIQRKGFHYVLSKSKRKDYDDLLIASYESNGPNATLWLNKEELNIRGIEKFNITDILNVYILPNDNEVTMLGNRDFRFNGTLYSGNFEFVGQDFTFSYDSFKVALPQIDSIRFFLADENGNRRKVDNTLQSATGDGEEKTSGTLFINKPDNKAGRKMYPDYPKFNAATGAIVYFDSPDILEGAYDKSVYFVIPPFAIDSLNNADPSSIGFRGTLYSGILPPIDETLKIRADNSMGFDHEVPSSGYQLYGGAGTYRNNLMLDAQGLHGEGNVDFLTTTLESEDFTFYMDSVTTVGTAADIEAGTVKSASFPQAYVEDYRLKWLPHQDSMIIYNNANPFELYGKTASLDSVLIVTERGLLGAGRLATRGSETYSKDMKFNENDFSALHAAFEIKSDNPKKPALAGDDVHLDFDLQANKVDIRPEEEGVAAIAFPYAMFKTSITQAVWDLEEESVRMSKPADVDIANSYFYATREELDSLAFNAEEAVYRIPLQQLDVSGVPYITVADAKITPENNQVQIRENAKFDTFSNATLLIDTLNEYHSLYDGTIDVLSRNKFKGKATYELVSATDTFAIEMTNFRQEEEKIDKRNTRSYTVADGQVAEKQNVIISPGMLYRGKVRLAAIKEALELDGEVKLNFKTVPDYNTWISYSSDAGQKQLVFDFDKSETDKGEPLVAGLHLSARDNSLYTTFVTDRRSPEDYDLFQPTGLLSYNEEKEEYSIRDPRRNEEGTLAGKVFSFNENTQTISFEGPVNLLPEPEKGMALTTSAVGSGNLDSNTFVMDAFMVMDTDIPAQALEIMGKDLNRALKNAGAKAANNDRTRLLYKLAEIIGDDLAKEYDKSSASEYTPLFSMAPQLEKTLVLSDIAFAWSDEQKAWYSTSPLGISNVGEQDVNARATGYLEIKPTEAGSVVNMFIQAAADSWYYFSYQSNRLAVWAYDEDFCDLLGEKSKIDKAGSDDFAFYLSDISETLTFINRFRKIYLGIEEPYNFDIVPQMVTEKEAKEEEKETEQDGF